MNDESDFRMLQDIISGYTHDMLTSLFVLGVPKHVRQHYIDRAAEIGEYIHKMKLENLNG